MTPERRLEIKRIVEHFKDAAIVNGEIIRSFCEREHIEPITEGEFKDWLYQYQFDQKAYNALPEIISVLANWRYLGEFSSQDEQYAEAEQAMKAMCDVFEKHDFEFRDVTLFTTQFSTLLSRLVVAAGEHAKNKREAVTNALILKQFGNIDPDRVPFKDYAQTCREMAKRIDSELK